MDPILGISSSAGSNKTQPQPHWQWGEQPHHMGLASPTDEAEAWP